MRRCLTEGCPYPARGGRSRCGTHGPKNDKWYGASQGAANPYGTAWQQLRTKAASSLPKTCGICGYPILRGELAHLDHIVPSSMGGVATSLADVQWAHQRCNIKKGGRNRVKRDG